MTSQYEFVKKMKQLYDTLQDDLSRTLFWDRLKYDIAPCVENSVNLYVDGEEFNEAQKREQYQMFEQLHDFHAQGKKVFLYGAGVFGRTIAELFQKDGVPFEGFCDTNALKLPNSILGKKVYPPEYLFENANKCYVLISTTTYYSEIEEYLLQHNISQDHIIPFFAPQVSGAEKKQYFEFMDFFRPGTAFVDGGCFDAADSYYFAQCCEGAYSKIFAFEPDKSNAQHCVENAKQWNLKNFDLIPAGLSNVSDTVLFATGNGEGGHIIDPQKDEMRLFDFADHSIPYETIELSTVDETVQNVQVGFIKLDIEGAELDALHGAQHTLMRDKPLLAICLYHKAGDMLAIMDYLHSLVPEYRFWIRHYSKLQCDTVLYAF